MRLDVVQGHHGVLPGVHVEVERGEGVDHFFDGVVWKWFHKALYDSLCMFDELIVVRFFDDTIQGDMKVIGRIWAFRFQERNNPSLRGAMG